MYLYVKIYITRYLYSYTFKLTIIRYPSIYHFSSRYLLKNITPFSPHVLCLPNICSKQTNQKKERKTQAGLKAKQKEFTWRKLWTYTIGHSPDCPQTLFEEWSRKVGITCQRRRNKCTNNRWVNKNYKYLYQLICIKDQSRY